MSSLISVSIDRDALMHNVRIFRAIVGNGVKLCPPVKANAYGHGLVEAAHIFRTAGAEYLAVNSVWEAEKLRASGDMQPIYVMGYVSFDELSRAVDLDVELVVYNRETIDALACAAQQLHKTVGVHLKVETGTHRQGVAYDEALTLADVIRSTDGVRLAGVAMHFANVEDTTNHDYARAQLAEFRRITDALTVAGHIDFLRHCGNSAATLLWPEAHFEMVRPGIATYGMWPSDETFTSLAVDRREGIVLKPALTWQTRIAQLKTISAGAKVGYGCSWEALRETRLAILPVGYYDGYVRAYGNRASVLIHGQRVPIVGRVCMNIAMADVTDIAHVHLEDEVVLLGKQNNEEITAEELGEISNTINYEVTTRIRESISRMVV